jgi:PST family polysaccharide transporter
MALYIIPKFRKIDTKAAFKAEVKNFYQTFLPYVMMGLSLIYLLKPYIVRLVFSENFQPVESLFLWQLLGDLVKVLSTVIAFHFLAKKMFWHFIIIEVFLFLNLYVSSITLIDNFGLKGAVMGHFVAYLMQYGIILLIFSSPIFGVLTDEDEKL